MRLVSIGFSLLLLAGLPAAAGDAPTLQPLRLDGTPVGTCAAPAVEAVPTSSGGFGALSTCTAEAQCQSTVVSCSGENTCTAVDRNCSIGERGYVVCDNQSPIYCPQSCCPCGSCGAIRWFKTPECCPSGFHVMEERRCTTSGWVNTGNTDCLVECGGTKP